MPKEIKLDQNQLAAVDKAVNSRLSVITGGAGSGKTTIIKHLAEQLKAKGESVLLAAFAGKAAARIKEATGYEASTIHRMLGWMGDRFTLGSLQDHTVIIDESSMVSSMLLAEITRRNPKRLVLVGDAAQLPPVGEGQPFHDIIHYFPSIVSRLTTCYRATEAVFKAATCIRNGDQPLMQDESEHEKWKMVPTGDARSTHQYILELARTGYLDFSQDIILTPRNDDEANGAAAIVPLNKDLVEIANPRESSDTDKFKAGDRILNTKNMPILDIWNGTTGTVVSVEPKGRLYIKTDYPVTGDNGEKTTSVTVPKEEVKNFKHAYALTVHKSQGSQYRKVVFVVLQRDAFALLDRAMIYTGVTRAKQECLVVGELRAFADAIHRNTSKATVFQQLARLGA